MKTKINKLLLGSCLVLLACLCSCDDYLSNVPKGQRIPTTLNDFSVMLADEYTNCREDVTQALVLLNDRYVSDGYLSYYELWNANYFWNENADRIAMNKSDETTYYSSYAGISTANLIIENAPTATEATDAQRSEVIAQAKILRAMKYFTLVNYYSKTYNASTAASDGGVPLITSAQVGASYTQPSVQAIYDFILQNINEALPALPERALNLLYADKATAYALAARVYLQMGNYQEALASAGEALKRNDRLFDWVAFYNDNAAVLSVPDVYQSITSPMGFDYEENYIFCHGNNSYSGNDLQMREDRGNRFEQGDAHFMSRWKIRTMAGSTYYNPNMGGYFNRGGLTTTEVYLIQAECLARTGNVAGAMDVLNTVRHKRILPEYYQPLAASSADVAIDMIIKVKGDALVQTIIPFCDARRLNLEPAHARTLTKVENGQQYTLSPSSHMWVMPFPMGAVKNSGNGTVTQNVER